MGYRMKSSNEINVEKHMAKLFGGKPMTQTEKLREGLRTKLEYGHTPEMSKLMMDIILLACKEAGLMFVPDEWDLANLCYQGKRDSGIRSATVDKIHSLIKEIEIG